MGSKKNIEMTENTDEIKIVGQETDSAETVTEVNEAGEITTTTKPKKMRQRSDKYAAVRSQVDKTKLYDPFAAVELIKKLSYSSFAGTLTADVVVREAGQTADVTFPHSTGKTLRVAIVTDELMTQIEAGILDFDVLITHPSFMPKLARHAKVLGPKGLMPNPKNGTITPNPELKKKELEGGKTSLKTEKKAPLMHVVIGKTNMETQALVENLNALMDALKGKALRVNVSATMSPSVKILIA